MANNLARMVGIPAALAGFALIGGIAGVVTGFILGEFAALITAIVMLNRARGLAWTHDFDRITAFALGCALVVGLLAALQTHWLPGLALVPVSLLLMAWLVRHERASIEGGARMISRMMRPGR
jgi:hypothetical protein